jgi:hypothetical protein
MAGDPMTGRRLGEATPEELAEYRATIDGACHEPDDGLLFGGLTESEHRQFDAIIAAEARAFWGPDGRPDNPDLDRLHEFNRRAYDLPNWRVRQSTAERAAELKAFGLTAEQAAPILDRIAAADLDRRAKQLGVTAADTRPEEPHTVTAKPRSSWDDTPFDDILDQIAAGTLELPTPTVGNITGTDTGLFYLGRVNGLAGESGSGKGWIAFATAVEQMKAGREFYYLDFEDSPALAMLRLVNGLGVDPTLLKQRMHYVHPREHNLAEIEAFVSRVRATPDAFVVIDSTGESIGQSGRAQNIDEEVAAWFQELAHPLSEAGATVLLIDHLVKSPEGGLWPSGSQRKRAAITGTQLIVEVVEAPSTDDDGMVILKVAKDRHGARSAGSAASFVRYTHEPFSGQLVVTFDPGKTAEQLKLERAAKAAKEAAAQLDADVKELQRLAPAPASVRDIKDRLGWGSTRATDALREYRSRVAS